MFVGQQLLQLFPLRLQVDVPILQELIFILEFESALALAVHLLLPLLDFVHGLVGEWPRVVPLLALVEGELLDHSLVIFSDHCHLLLQVVDVLAELFLLIGPLLLLGCPLAFPGLPLFLLGAPLLLAEAVLLHHGVIEPVALPGLLALPLLLAVSIGLSVLHLN